MKIKICGLCRPEDIEAVNTAQPDFIGFVFARNSPRYVSPKQAKLLKEQLSGRILAVGVFVDEVLDNIRRLADQRVIDIVQLHGSEDTGFLEAVKKSCGIPVVKAIAMNGEGYLEELARFETSSADYLLLDSGAGGTGRQFDYQRIGNIKKPFFLAGGLDPENVAAAARKVAPYGVDMSSGVETKGKKDRGKIIEAVRRIRNVQGKIR